MPVPSVARCSGSASQVDRLVAFSLGFVFVHARHLFVSLRVTDLVSRQRGTKGKKFVRHFARSGVNPTAAHLSQFTANRGVYRIDKDVTFAQTSDNCTLAAPLATPAPPLTSPCKT